MSETEQTDVERLKEVADKAKADHAAAVRLEDQRGNLLPKLRKRAKWLECKLEPLEQEISNVQRAIEDIKDGAPTDYRLRKPPTLKPKKGQEGPP